MSQALSVTIALTGLLAADPAGMYLPPSDTGGSEFQFNPDSTRLRQATKKLHERAPRLLEVPQRILRIFQDTCCQRNRGVRQSS
jgi:hypothetical protein